MVPEEVLDALGCDRAHLRLNQGVHSIASLQGIGHHRIPSFALRISLAHEVIAVCEESSPFVFNYLRACGCCFDVENRSYAVADDVVFIGRYRDGAEEFNEGVKRSV